MASIQWLQECFFVVVDIVSFHCTVWLVVGWSMFISCFKEIFYLVFIVVLKSGGLLKVTPSKPQMEV